MKPGSVKFPVALWLPLAAVLAVNAIVFSRHWNRDGAAAPSFLKPPGWLVGGVWVVLFILMGQSVRLIRRVPPNKSKPLVRLIIGLMLLCLAYPFYTGGLKYNGIGLAGNLVLLGLTACIIFRARPLSPGCAGCLFPILLWLIYASVITLWDY